MKFCVAEFFINARLTKFKVPQIWNKVLNCITFREFSTTLWEILAFLKNNMIICGINGFVTFNFTNSCNL